MTTNGIAAGWEHIHPIIVPKINSHGTPLEENNNDE